MARISVAGNYFRSLITMDESYYLKGGKNVALTSPTNDADQITGGNGSDYIDSAGGNDQISGGNGKDEIHAGAGDDRIGSSGKKPPGKSENGNDRLFGDAGNDLIYGGNGVDTISGGADGDVLFGGNARDIFSYALASDSAYSALDPVVLPAILWNAIDGSIWAQSWDVIADFRSGLDKIDLSTLDSGNGPVALVWGGAVGTDADAGLANALRAHSVWTDEAQNFLYADTTGDGKADLKIQAKGVKESDVSGLSSAFEITSGAAATVPENTLASVVVYDGDAVDPGGATLTYSITGTDAARFAIDADDGEVRFLAAPDFELPLDVGVNNVYDFVLHVNNGSTELTRGVAVTVTNVGEAIVGGAGNDTLSSGAANDTLNGGAGNDSLTGGAGADAFVFDTALDAGTNKDTISDFAPGSDSIHLDDDVFTALLTLGALGVSQFNSGAGLMAAADADDRIIYDTTTGALYYDADGDGGVAAAIQFAALGDLTHPAITAADFLIVA